MKWRSGQLIVLYTDIGFLICFLCLCVGMFVCLRNCEVVCMCVHVGLGTRLCLCLCVCECVRFCVTMSCCVCACMCMFVCVAMSCSVVFTSRDSSVASCYFIYHQRESPGNVFRASDYPSS